VAFEREVIREPVDQGNVGLSKVAGGHGPPGSAVPLVPIEVGPFKQRTLIGVRPCANRS
jgi:hypothetical protein